MAGSSWTNQVVPQVLIAGTLPGLLAYNPGIGANELIASVSGTQTTDGPPGNQVLQGVTAYRAGAGKYIATQLDSGLTLLTATTEAGPYAQVSRIAMSQGGDIDLNAGGSIQLVAGPGSGGSLIAQSAGGVAGYLPVTAFDISTNSAGNDGSVHNVTTAWSIPAGDAHTGTSYTIRGLLTVTTGQTTIETLTLGVNLGGVQTALATLGTAFNGGALSTTYAVPFELVMVVDAVSAGTPEIYLNAPLGDTSANRLSTNSANLQGFTHTASFSAASGATFALYAQWGGAGGSAQNAQTITSRLYREGP